MKRQVNMIVILLYIGIMLACGTACGKKEIPQEPTEIVTDTNKGEVNLLQTAWINSLREPEKSDSWSVEKYTEDFLPQITEGELGTLLYAIDNNFYWIFSEIWITGEDGNNSREYHLTKYDMNLAQCESFLYSLTWNDAITGFEHLMQGMEQLTFHIVEMDYVDDMFSFLVEGKDEERKVPLFYVVNAKQDGQVLSVMDISEVLLENNFNCSIDTMPGAFQTPGAFHKDKKGNLFIMDPEMLNVFVINADGTFSEIITPPIRTNLSFKGKLPAGEPVYDYSNGDGTRTIVTYDGTREKYLYKGELYWSGGAAFSNYGQAFYVDNKGLKCWNVVEGNTEIVCDRIETGIYDYLWMNDKEELFLISDGRSPYIVKLKNEPPQEVVELELCITTQSQYVEDCAIAYSMRHPNVRINISKISGFDDNTMNKLFTDVSEGKGPDILVLNRSDLISFYNAGALSDLSTVLSDDAKEQIYPGVLDYGTVDGKLVGITCEATVNTLFVSNEVWKDERWNLQEVLGIIRSREEAGDPIERVVSYSYSYVPHLMLSDLALMDITNSGFVNLDTKTCSFDSEEFLMLLEYCKQYGQEVTDDYMEEEDILAELNSGKSLVYECAGNFVTFSKAKAMLGDDYHCVGYPSKSKQGSFWQFYNGCVAVSSKSTKSEEANDFLRYLVDYSTQKKYALNWVRKDVLLDNVKDAVELYGNKEPVPVFFVSESVVLELDGKEDGSSYVKEYIELAEQCVPDKNEYEQINSIILEEVPAFFNGQKTAKQVAEIIQSRVTIFLEE